ncbi:MAG: manganese transporter [Flavobacteriales bacterium]|jgi:manganese/zinc/iron transport system substrate-binding protein|nr:manganese transporter [Flavobacteriales bacterium]
MRKVLFYLLFFSLSACFMESHDEDNNTIKIVCTTSIISDWVENIASEEMQIIPLLKIGIDPHVYKPSKKDLDILRSADVIIYHGLHLEGKIIEVLKRIEGPIIINAAQNYPKHLIISDPNFPASTDPHVWFDVDLSKIAISTITEEIANKYPQLKEVLESNKEEYLTYINDIAIQVKQIIDSIPEKQRTVVTTHDALSYFGRSFGFNVKTLQGASTVSEFGLKEITSLVDFVVEQKVPAIFLENIISPQAMLSVQKGCKAKGFEVKIGPELLSDSLGDKEGQNTYTGMLLFNAQTIAEYLR